MPSGFFSARAGSRAAAAAGAFVAGAVFGIFAALFYWFPKMTGRMLNERLGKWQFVLLFIGTNVAFFPQHLLGLDGMIRRIIDYAPNPGWTELNFLSTIGAFLVAISILPFLWNVFITLRSPATAGDDPWDQHIRNPQSDTFFEFTLTSYNPNTLHASVEFQCLARNMTDPSDNRLMLVMIGLAAMPTEN